ncbi:hypothetical protein [Halarcobacter bivalviorum]|uniref:hypothetical protein n=1 Tax=Halarcobacter bivalviorum TaxID=663364 RepID=UPI00100A8F54|nr:hypothetical protein [Halarcobacter bivalviorum]RXK05703.1 hypothetical protein CRU97_07260 [Halarcobacter bivalviorum]
MKKLILLMIFFIIGTIFLYFNQDRMAHHILRYEDIDTKTKYQFSKENYLLKIIKEDKIISFNLDDSSIKTSKSINGKVIEKYFWQGNEKLYIVTDANNKVIREYLYKTKYDTLPYGMKTNGQIYYFIYNKMKSLRVVVDNTNKIVKILDYDKNGKVVKDTNPLLQVDFSYGSGLLEPLSGILFFPEGTYDPKNSKWITKIKNDDILQNLQYLSTLPKQEVYLCSDTLDTYYHSYLCTNGMCGGFYAINYLEYFNAKGIIVDNSKYFHPNRCKKIELDNKVYDINKFGLCVEKKIQSKEIKIFDVLNHNCHHEVDEIINTCKINHKRGKVNVF